MLEDSKQDNNLIGLGLGDNSTGCNMETDHREAQNSETFQKINCNNSDEMVVG